jgi:protein-S-isoprenylcysteine O-methyltransferase Ste14
MGCLAAQNQALIKGWRIFGWTITSERIPSILFALAVCGSLMFISELIIRNRIEKNNFISVAEKLKNKRYLSFLIECLLKYSFDLALLYLIILFYQYTAEYGFQDKKPYYQPWFSLMNRLWEVYLYIGLPYIILTRAFQHNKDADKKEPSFLLLKIICLISGKLLINDKLKGLILGNSDSRVNYNTQIFSALGIRLGSLLSLDTRINFDDRKIFLGMLVKMFYIPVMTVFFAENFSHLVNNITYIDDNFFGGGPHGYSFAAFTKDIYHISFTVIFSIDVGLAWCGYVISSRWIKNSNVSVEPTILGWLVAILCYPPFRNFLGYYFPVPSDKSYFLIPNETVVFILTIMIIISYSFYMAATLFFGLRFSNLTHRGIIRRGPYSIVRHPAYLAKNFSWWCVMAPVVFYQVISKNSLSALIGLCGLIFMTALYYFRAITEEKHLSIDPAYISYCRKVKYRFIPGVY